MNETANETANQATEAAPAQPAPGGTGGPVAAQPSGAPADQAASTEAASSGAASTAKPTEAEPAAPSEVVASEIVTGEAPADEAGPATAEAVPPPLGAELAALRAELDERTGDLQRVTAEYANYRKRVERDRLAVAEQATAHVIAALLPVLDDLDRAREHGDLVGPFAIMAEQLGTTLAKFGLAGFGEVGDAFDPTRHEAVTHQTSAEVTAPTCVAVMRRGYLLGERLLRPALVAVADPESQ